jgi:hypothetical protein
MFLNKKVMIGFVMVLFLVTFVSAQTNDGFLMKKAGSDTIYLTDNGLKRPFYDEQTLGDYGFSLGSVIVFSDDFINSLSTGDSIYPIGHNSGNPPLYKNAYEANGGIENEDLGYAKSGEEAWGLGRIQYFTISDRKSALIYNNGKSKVYAVYGAIDTKYFAWGGADVIGLPYSDQEISYDSIVTGATPVVQWFEGGDYGSTVIVHHSTGPKIGLTVEIHGPIRDKWVDMSYGYGCAGLPISGVRAWNSGDRADFENGYLYYDGSSVVASCEDVVEEPEPTPEPDPVPNSGVDDCPNSGYKDCLDSNTVRYCGTVDGRLTWADQYPCPSGEICFNGVCSAPAQNECEPNIVRCSTVISQQTCIYSSDEGIYKWGSDFTCSYLCSEGSCIPEPGPSCYDNEQNQDETDVDCGGVCGSSCSLGDSCSENTDCEVGFCSTDGFACKQPVIFVHGVLSNDDIWDKFKSSMQGTNFIPYRIGEIFEEIKDKVDNGCSEGTFPGLLPGECHDTIPIILPEEDEENVEIEVKGYINNDGDIRSAASMLGVAVLKVKSDTGSNKVDVVAHSMGGLITRTFIKEYGGGQHLRKLVMLGTPNQGSPIVQSTLALSFAIFKGDSHSLLSVPKAFEQMDPLKDFTKNLNLGYDDSGVTHYLIAGSNPGLLTFLDNTGSNDGAVPIGNMRLEDRWDCYQYLETSHVSFGPYIGYYDDSEVISDTLRILNDQPVFQIPCVNEGQSFYLDEKMELVNKIVTTIKQSDVFDFIFDVTFPSGDLVAVEPDTLLDGYQFDTAPLLLHKAKDALITEQSNVLDWNALGKFETVWEGSTTELMLTSPSGEVINYAYAEQNDEVLVSVSEVTNAYFIRNIEEGEWTATVVGVDIPEGGEQLEVSLALQTTIHSLLLDIDDATLGDTVKIIVVLLDDVEQLPGASVKAHVIGQEEIIVLLYDDGNHGDLVEGDGVYAGEYLAPSTGTYLVNLIAEGNTLGGTPFKSEALGSFEVLEPSPITQCWSGENEFIDRGIYQLRKFCSCAEGNYDARSFGYEYDRNAVVSQYIDSDENENWETETISGRIKISRVMCGDLNWYNTNQDYFIEGDVIVPEDNPECLTDSECDNGLYCDGAESCVNEVCVSGNTVDCSSNDLSEINTCNVGRWNYFEGFTSTCDEAADSCSVGTTIIYQICSINQCSAECEDSSDCLATECDNLDGCVGNDYYDYSDVSNSCDISYCGCSQNSCGEPIISADDSRCTTETCTDADSDGFCAEDNDCNDNNSDINPSASEICDEIDNNCDSNIDEDLTCDLPPLNEGEFCWSAGNKYLYRSVLQFKKFCSCASGEYGYSTYNLIRERGVDYLTYEYADNDNNQNWETQLEGENSYAVNSLQCNDGNWYDTNQDYYA